jgi:hypothetical protein
MGIRKSIAVSTLVAFVAPLGMTGVAVASQTTGTRSQIVHDAITALAAQPHPDPDPGAEPHHPGLPSPDLPIGIGPPVVADLHDVWLILRCARVDEYVPKSGLWALAVALYRGVSRGVRLYNVSRILFGHPHPTEEELARAELIAANLDACASLITPSEHPHSLIQRIIYLLYKLPDVYEDRH